MQYQVRTGPITHTAAPFTNSMVDGSHPDRPRLFKPPLGWQISQPTHTAATFSLEMVAGSAPPQPRPTRGKTGWTWSETTFDAPMTPEQFAGWHPDRARAFTAPRLPLPLSPAAQNTAAAFGPEMVVGWHPDTGRFFIQPKIGWQTAQPTHTAAAFGPEMVQGAKPDQARPTTPHQWWITSQTTFDVPMTPEQFAGWHPDTARAWLAPKIPLPISQPTHTAAPFGHEMVAGSKPDQARVFQRPRLGWQWAETTFAVEMTPEQWAGWRPDTSRAWIAPRIPLPFSETSPIEAPFGPEMVQGARPDPVGQYFQARLGWITTQTEFEIVPPSPPPLVDTGGGGYPITVPPKDHSALLHRDYRERELPKRITRINAKASVDTLPQLRLRVGTPRVRGVSPAVARVAAPVAQHATARASSLHVAFRLGRTDRADATARGGKRRLSPEDWFLMGFAASQDDE